MKRQSPGDTYTVEESTHSEAAGRHEAAPQGPRASLVLHGEDGPQVVLLPPGEWVLVGRAPHADLRVRDSGLSREHARFRWDGTQLMVQDLGSTNGTRVRGERIEVDTLRPGETITLGHNATAVLYVLSNGQAPARGASQGTVIESPKMRSLYALVDRVAPTDAPVLIHGETGTGKELVASAIHARSPRSRGPFKAVNCGAIPSTLAESVLFGHERGAFTGAHGASPGLFEQARDGVLFLDEVAELSPELQAALLRVLEKKVIVRLGDQRERPVDVRVVAATHHDLEQRVRQGKFREDLLYRLNTVTLCVPPLRDRKEEIAALADLFLDRASQAWQRPVRAIDPEAMRMLRSHPWPGNVRQLRNVIERAVIACSTDVVMASDLQLPSPAAVQPPTVPAPEGDLSQPTFRDRVRDYEASMIEQALTQSGGNRRAASRLLRIPVRTLTQKIKDYDLG